MSLVGEKGVKDIFKNIPIISAGFGCNDLKFGNLVMSVYVFDHFIGLTAVIQSKIQLCMAYFHSDFGNYLCIGLLSSSTISFAEESGTKVSILVLFSNSGVTFLPVWYARAPRMTSSGISCRFVRPAQYIS